MSDEMLLLRKVGAFLVREKIKKPKVFLYTTKAAESVPSIHETEMTEIWPKYGRNRAEMAEMAEIAEMKSKLILELSRQLLI